MFCSGSAERSSVLGATQTAACGSPQLQPAAVAALSDNTRRVHAVERTDRTMLREVVNAVVLTFVVSEWLSEKPGRRLVLFARRDASTKALCAALGSALLIVNFVGDHVPALGGLLASNIVAAIVEGAVVAAGAYGTAKITKRPCFCGVPTLKKGEVEKSAFLRAFAVCTILCYVQGGMSFAHVYVPRAVVAAAAFVAVLYVDVRRTVDVKLKTFGKELARAAAYVAPLYPLLAILCSLIFVPIMSLSVWKSNFGRSTPSTRCCLRLLTS